MKILHLTLKKKWFDMIASGEKKEEYREIKLYWGRRLLKKIATPWGGNFWPWKDIEDGDFEFHSWREFVGNPFRDFDIVRLKNGYGDRPTVDVKWLDIHIGEGKPEWGAEPGKKYFVIKLGDKI